MDKLLLTGRSFTSCNFSSRVRMPVFALTSVPPFSSSLASDMVFLSSCSSTLPFMSSRSFSPLPRYKTWLKLNFTVNSVCHNHLCLIFCLHCVKVHKTHETIKAYLDNVFSPEYFMSWYCIVSFTNSSLFLFLWDSSSRTLYLSFCFVSSWVFTLSITS